MTGDDFAAKFADVEQCGCPVGAGHRCDPGFKTLEQVRRKYVPIGRAA